MRSWSNKQKQRRLLELKAQVEVQNSISSEAIKFIMRVRPHLHYTIHGPSVFLSLTETRDEIDDYNHMARETWDKYADNNIIDLEPERGSRRDKACQLSMCGVYYRPERGKKNHK